MNTPETPSFFSLFGRADGWVPLKRTALACPTRSGTAADHQQVGVVARSLAALDEVNEALLGQLAGAAGQAVQCRPALLGEGSQLRGEIPGQEPAMVGEAVTGDGLTHPGAERGLGEARRVVSPGKGGERGP